MPDQQGKERVLGKYRFTIGKDRVTITVGTIPWRIYSVLAIVGGLLLVVGLVAQVMSGGGNTIARTLLFVGVGFLATLGLWFAIGLVGWGRWRNIVFDALGRRVGKEYI